MERTWLSRSNAIALLCVLLTLLLFNSALAQTGTSSVHGTVTDPQGNVVAGATVTLIDSGTNTSRTQISNGSGNYTFDFIPPGDYRVEAESKGFKKAAVTDVHALVSKPTEVNLRLEIGNVTETVTVGAGAETLVNTQDASVGNNFVSQQITQLPLESRNVTALLTLQPGVTREGYASGARSDQANVTLDGVDINEQQSNRPGGPTGGGGSNAVPDQDPSPDRNTVIRLNSEAIEEFRVTTSNPNASQGRSSGAQITLVTKSGTNEWHGSAFEYHRNTLFTANDFFNNRNGRYTATDFAVVTGHKLVGEERVPRPKLLRNTFSGALGGPIIKDRAFFFYNYEGRRDSAEKTVVEVVPQASLGRGEVRYLNPSGGVTTVTAANLATIFPQLSGVNPAAVSALAAAAAKYPVNDDTVGDGLNTGGFRFNAKTPVKLNSHAAKFDLKLTNSQTLFVRVNVQHDLLGGLGIQTDFPQAFPDTPLESTWSHPWGLAVGHTWAISNRFVNNFRYGFTREAFSIAGDSTDNAVSFRFVFSPRNYDRSLSRTTPVQNFADDFSWIKGNHTAQFGVNISTVRNRRINYANSYDTALTNPSFYASSGTPLSTAINGFSPIRTGFASSVQNAASAVLGRFTQYSARYIFDKSGNLQPRGAPSVREFATEGYDFYAQDTWKMRTNLTLTFGLRYGLSRPIYETQGYETKPNIPLSDYFQKRLDSAAKGIPFNDPISVDLSGPANGRSPMYRWDKNNFQPRVAVAWSPKFKNGWLRKIFGNNDSQNNSSVLRGGFAITNDYFGQQLAVTFDGNNTLGFSSNFTTSAGTYNTNTRPGPLFTGYVLDVRGLPRVVVPGSLTFPQIKPSDGSRRIESSLDENLVTPINYSWNLTFERELPHGLVLQTSYIGRAARHLLATRDIMALNNLVDPKSGMDWYTAAGQLEQLRAAGTPISAVPAIPYFENLFGGFSGFAAGLLGSSRAGLAANATQAVYGDAFIFNANDWTQTQDDIEGATGVSFFFNPQYGALSAFSTIGKSNYHAGTLSVRERLGQKLTLDFNYTLSHSLDDASGLQTSTTFATAFILNPIRQQDNYASSDFDVRHNININAIWQLPFGHGQWLMDTNNKWVNGILGGWQLSAIYRWNSGLPIFSPYDAAQWATNWNAQSSGVRIRPVQSCPTRGGINPPKLFGCDPNAAFKSWRNARPGETGDRNVIRLPGYVNLDMGLGKTFTMPWSEKHKLQIRWEAFNVTNTQRLGRIDSSRTGFGLTPDPSSGTPPPNWSNFTKIQGTPRVMQVGFRYEF
jgi:hypothetical protein